ncbi:MAG: hypothetical protein IKA93_02950 [Elusimicrobiaceae bacterium]|nr:hypothetical protein [Elusimicrobiaceae bacterium]
MPKTTKPAYNPALQQTQAGKDDYLLKTLKMGLFCAAPAFVESYDRGNMRATIRPALMAKKSDGESIPQDFIFNVPVRFCGGGGYTINLPLKKGDTGWLIFCDRDIANFKQARSVLPCNTNRMHAQEDPFFLPDAMQTATISGEDSGRAVFQTLNGANKISLGETDIKITTTKLTVNASQSVEFITPQVTMSGLLTVTGIITSIANVVAGAISLLTHTHSGVESGPDSTGGPQ